MAFKPVDQTKTLQQLEDETILYWKQDRTFEKSIEQRPENEPYTFVDGPPFVSGMPHYGHLLTSVPKDLIPRYWTMQGKRVRRVWGWDCHGLPIEAKVNQKLKVKTAKEVEEKIGVDKYISECRTYVQGHADEWRWYIDKIGRWVDLDNAYYTMSTDYMESVIWAFKQTYQKGLIYTGKRVSLYSTDTQTPVSNFEVAMDPDNYQDVDDLSIFVKFKLSDESRTKLLKLIQPEAQNTSEHKPIYLVAWTTTPWTIPANFALAVNKKFVYSVVEYETMTLVVARERLAYTFNEDAGHIGTEEDKIVRVIGEVNGTDLEGFEYTPVYDYFASTKTSSDFKVYLSDDVTADEGTGILHIAPAYGEVDFQIGKKYNLSDHSDIDEEGNMVIEPWKGIYLRKASPLIAEHLQEIGSLLRSEVYRHRLPFYRGENPLIYIAQNAYFINIQKIKDRMLDLNQDINWIPEHIKTNRFANTLSTSPDWCISRNRFWATIMPIWKSNDGDEIVIGSIEEMAQYTDQLEKREVNGKSTYYFQNKSMDLHRDVCDQIVLKKNGKEYHRIPEVLDCWMDSGSAPFAEHHYPFENKEAFEKSMPADFIIEYVGQVRAWFNVLHRISTILFDRQTFTNVICHGVLAGTDGRKMSKTYGNYPDPKMVLEKYGADALRLNFAINPILSGEDMNINENDIADQVKSVLNIFWNSYKYFITYALANSFELKLDVPLGSTPYQNDENDTMLDRWIKVRLKETINEISAGIEEYNIPRAARPIRSFVDDLSTWYIRRSRTRFATGDKHALSTLGRVLIGFSRAAAPVIPFITESVFRGLTEKESVHLERYPQTGALTDSEKQMLESMMLTRQIASLGQAARLQAKMPIKQPLQTAQIETQQYEKLSSEYLNIIAEELNVKTVSFVSQLDSSFSAVEDKNIKVGIDTKLNEDLEIEGKLREITRALQELRKQAGLQVTDEIQIVWNATDPIYEKSFERYSKEIKSIAKISSFQKSEAAKTQLLPGVQVDIVT